MAKLVLVRMCFTVRRMGCVEALFICDQDKLETLYGQEARFGEILGKHSEITITLSAEHFVILTEDANFVLKIAGLIGTDISGYNPFEYVRDPDTDEPMEAFGVESYALLAQTDT